MKTIEEIMEEIEQGIGVSINYAMRHCNKEQQINIIKNISEKYAKQCCDEQIGDFGFGSFCSVEQKRYVGENEFYTYKVISVIESNGWVDIPVDARVNKIVLHDSMEKVVICICMGVSEDKVTRFKLSDVIKLSTPNVVTTK